MSPRSRAGLGCAAVAALLGCASPEPGPAPPPSPAATAPLPPGPTGTASIVGRVRFEGTVPPPERIDMASDPSCLEAHPDGYERQRVKVADGGLAEVLVYVSDGIDGYYPPPAEPVVLDQQACTYSPHVVALQVGQGLRIENLDETLHNIHPRPSLNREFNVGQPRRGMSAVRIFEKPELMIPVRCDVHPWMSAALSVLPNPFFAITTADGSFGVEARHETLGPATARITLQNGETGHLDLTLRSPDHAQHP
jgi:hypothetical protein